MPYRYPEPIMQMIWASYCPTVKDSEGTETPDPDVLYVGPVVDGICTYMPELTRGIPSEAAQQPANAHRLIKSIILDLSAGDRARNFDMRNVSFIMVRMGWPRTRDGQPQQLLLSDRLVDVEPGELLNSYIHTQDPETMEVRWMERAGPKNERGQKSLIPFTPKLRKDLRWGLHYLRRNDRFTFSFTDRRGVARSMDFVLRPLSEGSSLVTPEVRTQQATW